MYNLYSTIEELCNSRGIKVSDLSKDIGLHRNVLPRLKSNPDKKLSLDTVQKIASYFNVPVDYLLDLGEINPKDIPPEPSITESQFLFALYGEVPEEIDADDIADIKKYAEMVRLRKLAEKKGD